ncbi:MAG: hypothetical protein ACOVOD_14405 [Rhodoferax sp.]
MVQRLDERGIRRDTVHPYRSLPAQQLLPGCRARTVASSGFVLQPKSVAAVIADATRARMLSYLLAGHT